MSNVSVQASSQEQAGSELAEFFGGKTVLLTGATGFVGKVLLAHLLAISPKILRIYCLIRGDISTRFQKDVLAAPFFKDMLKHNPSLKDKLQPISGDVGMDKLGLSDSDQAKLQREVNIILHCAANVQFNNPIKMAVELNALGGLRMLNLAKSCKNLVSHIHVSTCYVNSYQHIGDKHIEEKIYPFPSGDPNQVLEQIMKMSGEESEVQTEQLKSPFPNTYSFSKALGEHLLQLQKDSVPLAIVRPSIVASAQHFPVPGWVEGAIGGTGIYLKIGVGQLHVYPSSDSQVPDLVPVDAVTALIMAAAMNTAKEHHKTREKLPLRIYQAATTTVNPIVRHHLRDIIVDHFSKYPAQKTVGKPWQWNVSGEIPFLLWFHLIHTLPAYFSDSKALFGLTQSEAKPNSKAPPTCFPNAQKAGFLLTAAQTLQYFTDHQWYFSAKNTAELFQSLNATDKSLLSALDLQKLDWFPYINDYCFGMKKFILRERPPTSSHSAPQAKL